MFKKLILAIVLSLGLISTSFAAVTVTPILAGTTTWIGTVTATADGDITATIPHGLGAVPNVVLLDCILDACHTSRWFAGTIDGTNVVLTKGTGGGSGAGGAQLRVVIMLPHSLIR